AGQSGVGLEIPRMFYPFWRAFDCVQSHGRLEVVLALSSMALAELRQNSEGLPPLVPSFLNAEGHSVGGRFRARLCPVLSCRNSENSWPPRGFETDGIDLQPAAPRLCSIRRDRSYQAPD